MLVYISFGAKCVGVTRSQNGVENSVVSPSCSVAILGDALGGWLPWLHEEERKQLSSEITKPSSRPRK